MELRSKTISPPKRRENIPDINKSMNESECSDSNLDSTDNDQQSSGNTGEDINENSKRSPGNKVKRKPQTAKETSTPKQTQNIQNPDVKGKNYFNITIMIVVVVVGVVAIICKDSIDFYQHNPNSETVPPKLIEIFASNMNHIKEQFPTQTSRFWKIIKVSLKRIIQEENPDYPSVILLVVPKGTKASQTGTCIAERLTKIVNTLFNMTTARIIDIPTAITHSSPDVEKKDLDNRIKDSFENEHLKSIAIDHFEQLSPRASLLFHGYCDGDNAPFKRVAIVFILHTQFDAEYLNNDPAAVDKHLIELWSRSDFPLDRDKIDPLISRVANNAAIVTEEDKLNCS